MRTDDDVDRAVGQTFEYRIGLFTGDKTRNFGNLDWPA